MRKYKRTKLANVFRQNTLAWDIDIPKFLGEVIECSNQRMYKPTWDILIWYINAIAQRASEINDPVLNAIMVRMNLYDIPLTERDNILQYLECVFNNNI